MHAYIVFAHPTRRSFTGEVLDELCRGLDDGGHSYEIGDLYEMDFKCEMTPDEYILEMNVQGNRPTLSIPPDVEAEHSKFSAGSTFNDHVSAGRDKSVGEWRVIYGTGHLLRRT